MSFNLYFAGSQAAEVDKYLQQKNCLRLFSYLNEKKGIDEWKEQLPKNLFIDSGAFSVAHNNKTVDIDAYIDYINSNPEINIFVELDKIPYPILNKETAKESSEVSWKNYLYMKERVTSPCNLLPLYHFGESIDHLKRILNTPYKGELPAYIGIGGRHGVSTKLQELYFQNIFDVVKSSDNPNVKIHVFGMTVLSTLEKFPFYSADSTTWLQLGVNGNIFSNKYGIINVSERQKKAKDNIFNFHNDAKNLIEEEIKLRGYTLEELSTEYKKRLMFNIDSFKEWADNYKYKPERVGSFKKLF